VLAHGDKISQRIFASSWASQLGSVRAGARGKDKLTNRCFQLDVPTGEPPRGVTLPSPRHHVYGQGPLGFGQVVDAKRFAGEDRVIGIDDNRHIRPDAYHTS